MIWKAQVWMQRVLNDTFPKQLLHHHHHALAGKRDRLLPLIAPRSLWQQEVWASVPKSNFHIHQNLPNQQPETRLVPGTPSSELPSAPPFWQLGKLCGYPWAGIWRLQDRYLGWRLWGEYSLLTWWDEGDDWRERMDVLGKDGVNAVGWRGRDEVGQILAGVRDVTSSLETSSVLNFNTTT